MINGLRTATYTVDDLEAARAWYSEILGREPHFDEPFYVGFDVGGYELGLLPDDDNTGSAGTSAVAYWGVDDIETALERLQKKGASLHDDVQDVGEGIRLATVNDPFGNVLGVIENPNFTATG